MLTIRIWFEKRGEAAYISLLDLQRVMQRVLKRSGLPVWYTQGFNPHIYMTFTCPLALGQESLCESVDVRTEQPAPDLNAWQSALNAIMPAGIRVFRVEEAGGKAEHIGFAEYRVRYPAAAREALERYNGSGPAPMRKKTKRGFKEIDLKQYAPTLALAEEPGEDGAAAVAFTVRLPASQELTVNPALLCEYLEAQFGLPAVEAAILRTGLFTREGEAFR